MKVQEVENMENSSSYYENRECKYYPCHKGTDEINCMFCYCPLYEREKCPGNPSFIREGENRIKDCSNCLFPHQAKNYEVIIKMLMEKK